MAYVHRGHVHRLSRKCEETTFWGYVKISLFRGVLREFVHFRPKSAAQASLNHNTWEASDGKFRKLRVKWMRLMNEKKIIIFTCAFRGSYENVKLALTFQAVNLKSIFGSKCPKTVRWGQTPFFFLVFRLLFFLMLFYVCQFYWGVKDIDDVVLIIAYLNDFIQDFEIDFNWGYFESWEVRV